MQVGSVLFVRVKLFALSGKHSGWIPLDLMAVVDLWAMEHFGEAVGIGGECVGRPGAQEARLARGDVSESAGVS